MCRTAAEQGVTEELIRWHLEHPRQAGTGTGPRPNCSKKLDLFWETVSVYIRIHSSTGRKARHLFFGKITNVHQSSEPPSGSRGILLIWQARLKPSIIQTSIFFFEKSCPLYIRPLRPNLLSQDSGLSLLSVGQSFPDHTCWRTLVLHKTLVISILWF